ncbi:MAG: chemotaxis protein CheA [Verrucomicrobiales bacterium]|nr:chemotaxis protein CheA [Verrucomicrobiales bacterium]
MAGSHHESVPPERASEILAQIGVELAFVEPGRDTGLLPLNSGVMDLEEFVQPSAPPVLAAGIAVARGWLDRMLDGPGTFSSESIREFHDWHGWMQAALEAWGRGGILQPLPGAWGPGAAAASQPQRPSPGVSGVAKPPALAGTVPPGDEPGIRLNLTDDLELLREFHAESGELLQNIEAGVLQLEENPRDAATLNSIFRAFHTFKGGAGFLHLDALRDLAHQLESVLDAARRGDLAVDARVINLILAGGDALKRFTQEIGAQLQGVGAGTPIVVPTREVLARARAVLRGDPEAGMTTAPPAAHPAASPAVAPAALPAGSDAGIPTAVTPAGSVPPVSLAGHPAPPALSSAVPGSTPRVPDAVSEGAAAFIKLDTRKLDTLVELVGELVIAQSMVVQHPEIQRVAGRELARNLRQLARITSDLQRTALSLRLVPIRPTFQKMTRLVRDLAAQQHKQVHLELEGEDTELDRTIVEALGDPLVHMIRNSADHGIEPPAERVASGKPAQGTIRLSAAHERGGVVLRIADDGRGLDRDRILAKARERGLVAPGATPTESEIFALIFAPGFSTAETVTDLSGRGVGMDVVRRNLETLRGKIEIESAPGRGTVFTLVLPLTLAIIDGLLVGVGDERYILPALSVRESFRPRPGAVSAVQERGEVVGVRGRLTPLLRLGPHLGTPARAVDPADGIVVVVESGDAVRAVLVDELIGKQEVVIKSLGTTFRSHNLLAGAAILGDGRVGLILDADSLVRIPVSSLNGGDSVGAPSTP